MQRFFSTFPAGRPGLGLLLLRVAIGATLIMQGSAYLIHQRDVRIAAWAVCLLALGSGISLLLGFLTPVAGALAALGGLGATFMFFPAGHWNFFGRNPLSLDVIVMAVATAVLGPGSFSLDARRFGRRRVTIPRSPCSPTS